MPNENIQLEKSSDEELMLEIQNGSHLAFSTLTMRHLDKFYSTTYRIVCNKENAEDIIQNAFIKLWQNPNKWQKKKNVKFTTWFYRIVVNLALDFNRKKKLQQLPEDFDLAAESENLDEKMDRKKIQNLIDYWILNLPENQQIAINLCFYENLGMFETAEIMDISYKALESLLMRAKNNLKQKVKAWEDLHVFR